MSVLSSINRCFPALCAVFRKKKGFGFVKILHWLLLALFSAAAALARLRLLAVGFDADGLPVPMDFNTMALPAVLIVGGFLAVAWRYGRLYCGWLCPHFSLVELLNHMLQKACGRLSLWNRKPTPRHGLKPDWRWWPVFVLLCLTMGFVWAITLLTYLLPPADGDVAGS